MKLVRSAVAAALNGFERIGIDGARGRAAVAMTLVPAANTAGTAFVLTQRSAKLRTHTGQWALPGGRLDPGETPNEAVLREYHEEIGVRLDPDRILGALDDFVTRSGYCITPIVVWAADLAFAADPNPDEVAAVHLIPVGEIDTPPNFIRIPESERPVIQVPLLGSHIHAPTGAILYQFREVVLHGRATRVAHFEQPVFAWK